MQDTPAGKAAARRRVRISAEAAAAHEAIRQQGALAERKRIVEMLRERAREHDGLAGMDGITEDAIDLRRAALLVIADELEAQS